MLKKWKQHKVAVRALKKVLVFSKKATKKYICENICWYDADTGTCYMHDQLQMCNATCPFWRKK